MHCICIKCISVLLNEYLYSRRYLGRYYISRCMQSVVPVDLIVIPPEVPKDGHNLNAPPGLQHVHQGHLKVGSFFDPFYSTHLGSTLTFHTYLKSTWKSEGHYIYLHVGR